MVTDVGTELSVPMDMIMPNIPFSLLTAYQILALDGIVDRILDAVVIIYIMCVQMHWYTHDVHDRPELFL